MPMQNMHDLKDKVDLNLGILRRMEAASYTSAETDLETYMKDVISRHNSQFLRGALAWREINV